MSLLGNHESRRRFSPLGQRGYDYCCQIRESINALRQMRQEPRAIWLGQDGYIAIRQSWYEVLGDSWDGIIPKYIAGVPCRVGSTGGQDYVIEFFDDDKESAIARSIKDSVFKASDNPLYGTH